MKKIGILMLCMLFALATLAGCGNGGDTGGATTDGTTTDGGAGGETTGTSDSGTGQKFKVGFAVKTQDSPYFIALANAVKQYCTENGWDCTVLDAGGDTMKEAENMETFVTQGMDLIFLDCIEPDACIPSINAAADAGIPVINLDSGVGEGANDVTTVYSDNLQNGRKVGLAYVEKIGKEAPIKAIILSGVKGNIAGQERRTGLFCGIIEGRLGVSEEEAWALAEQFNSDLTNNGKAENADAKFVVAGQGWGSWTEEEGLAAAEDLITANTDLTCVLGENDQMLFGAMTALDNAGITGVDIVAAADGAQRAYDLIKEDKYFGTGENSPWMVARGGVDIAKQILVDGAEWSSFDKITLTEAIAVTKENVDERYQYGF